MAVTNESLYLRMQSLAWGQVVNVSINYLVPWNFIVLKLQTWRWSDIFMCDNHDLDGTCIKWDYTYKYITN
jgi:hypothetical protein